MRQAVTAAVATLALVGAAPAYADGTLLLEPQGGGSGTYASWKAQEGEADDQGAANQALYLQSGGATATVVVRGLEGFPVRALAGLSWEHRKDGRCDATNPRWTVFIGTPEGRRFKPVRFGCATALHSPGSEPGWIRDTNPIAVIRARIRASAGAGALRGIVTRLEIDFGPLADSYTFLDNVRVNQQVWTCAADNGNGPPPPRADDPTLDELAAAAAPLDDWELMSAEDLLLLGIDTSEADAA